MNPETGEWEIKQQKYQWELNTETGEWELKPILDMDMDMDTGKDKYLNLQQKWTLDADMY
jgi:hypothetical protein